MTSIQKEWQVGQALTDQEKADFAWMEEAKAGSVAAINDSLRLFAGLSATMFGLLVTFFDKSHMPALLMTLGCLLLLLTLAASLYGSLPPTFKTAPLPKILREQRQRLYQQKRLWYKWAGGLFFSALAVFSSAFSSEYCQATKRRTRDLPLATRRLLLRSANR